MLMIYIMLNILSSLVITIKAKKVINAIVIYNCIWCIMVILYHTGLIEYYSISKKTWFILVFSELSLSIGYCLGRSLKFKTIFRNNINYQEISKNRLCNCIKIMLFISAIAIVPNTYAIICRYGFNLLSVTRQIYYDNITGNATSYIPYFGCASQAAMILCGIYVSKFGFSKIVIFSFVMSILYGLPTGSRGYLLFDLLFFLIPLLITSKNLYMLIRKYGKPILLVFFIGVVIYQILTANRSNTVQIEPYMSDKMIELTNKYPTIYKNFTYFTGSLGVLNAYLNDMNFYFGMNSFYSVYNLFNKFGTNFKVVRYQDYYDIPYRTNVGTWLRELMQDFGIAGMLFIVFLFAFLLGHLEMKRDNGNINIKNLYVVTVMYAMLIMSFYVWYLREGFIYVLIILFFVVKRYTKGYYI